MQKICYVEEIREGGNVPTGFRVRRLTEKATPTAWSRLLGSPRGTLQIVYKERCRLEWDNLELVSVVPSGSLRGAMCWCDIWVEVNEPDSLLADVGQEGVVTLESLEAWFRPRLVEALEDAGGPGDLTSENYWPTIAEEVVRRLTPPQGVCLDRSGESEKPPRPACVVRKLRTFEQHEEEVKLKSDYRTRLKRVLDDGTLALAALQGRLEQFLDETRLKPPDDWLTLVERQQSTLDRLATCVEILGHHQVTFGRELDEIRRVHPSAERVQGLLHELRRLPQPIGLRFWCDSPCVAIRGVGVAPGSDVHGFCMGQGLRFRLRADRDDCYLRMLVVSSDTRSKPLFPNEHCANYSVRGGEDLLFPDRMGAFQYYAEEPPGLDTLVAVLAPRRFRLFDDDKLRPEDGPPAPSNTRTKEAAETLAILEQILHHVKQGEWTCAQCQILVRASRQ